MKKYLWNYGILVGIIIFLAVGIPRITSNEVASLHSPEEKRKWNNFKKVFENGHLNHWIN